MSTIKPLAVVNIERLKSKQFFVVLYFAEDGYLHDQVILPFNGYPQVINKLQELKTIHGVNSLDVHTSNREIYKSLLEVTGITGFIKHRSDTDMTRRAIEDSREILIELYGLKSVKLPRWKAFLIRILQRIIKKLEGDGNYEV